MGTDKEVLLARIVVASMTRYNLTNLGWGLVCWVAQLVTINN